MSELTAFDDEDIPADIWATAEGMALESDGHPGVWSLKESLARAIYIERERAAAFAYAKHDWPARWIAASFRGENSAYYDFQPPPSPHPR